MKHTNTHAQFSKASVLTSTLFCLMFFVSNFSFSQINTEWKTQGNTADSSTFIGTTNDACLRFRSNNIERMRISDEGNVGIGIENPLKRLDIDGDIQLTGDITFKGYENLQDTINRFLAIDKYGKTKPKDINSLRSSLYEIDCYKVTTEDTTALKSTYTVGLTLPSWANRIADDKQILYTGVGCPTWVGIGTNLPSATLDVRGDAYFSRGVRIGLLATNTGSGLYIENKTTASNNLLFENLILVKNENDRKLLQLNNDGLLRAREIKVDMDTWPDYVFKKEYELLSLNEVKTFIDANGHLPNVPSAKEIEADGVNLGQAAKTSMEKIEELTLYLFEINEKVENQEKEQQVQAETIKLQQELLQQQQNTIRLQQELIEELKNNNPKK